jgi:hypothetical protein
LPPHPANNKIAAEIIIKGSEGNLVVIALPSSIRLQISSQGIVFSKMDVFSLKSIRVVLSSVIDQIVPIIEIFMMGQNESFVG